MFRFIILFFVSFCLTACGILNPPREDKNYIAQVQAEAKVAVAQATAAVPDQKPIVEMTCPTSGCIIASFKMYNPNGAAAPAQAAPVQRIAPAPVQVDPWASVWEKGIGVFGNVAALYIGGKAAVDIAGVIGNSATAGYKAIQPAQPNIVNTTTTSTSTNNNKTVSTAVVSGNGSAEVGSGTATANPTTKETTITIPTTTTTSTVTAPSTTTNNSNNPSTVTDTHSPVTYPPATTTTPVTTTLPKCSALQVGPAVPGTNCVN